jgi:hypothetical protein
MHQPFAPVAAAGYEIFAPGEELPDPKPGDFVLTHGKAWTSRLIRFGQRRRFRGDYRRYAHWNHAALIVGTDGAIIEALGAGVKQRNISIYRGTEYHVIRVLASDDDRKQEVRFGKWSLNQPYGWLTISSIAFGLITGGKFTFGFDGQHICSGLVARALERTDALFNRSPTNIMPADLAKYFQVEPPPPGTPKGTVPAP